MARPDADSVIARRWTFEGGGSAVATDLPPPPKPKPPDMPCVSCGKRDPMVGKQFRIRQSRMMCFECARAAVSA